ncbi:uncharacterized protein LOC118149439 [Callithrix jacchus]
MDAKPRNPRTRRRRSQSESPRYAGVPARDPDPSRRRIFHPGTARHQRSPLPNLSRFFSGQPSRSCSQRSGVPRATPSGRAHDTAHLPAPFPIHSSRSVGQRSREPPAFAPSADPGKDRLRQSRVSKRGMQRDGEPDCLGHPCAPTHPPHALSQPGKPAPSAEKGHWRLAAERTPDRRHQEPFAPQVKRES